jgi:hypothetical protein
MKHPIKPILALTFAFTALGLGTTAFAHEGHDHAAAAADAAKPADAYPLTTCIVSGDKLGEMGEPVHYVYKQPGKPDRVVQFCCKDCIKDFEKEPAKYLAVLDAAEAHHGGAHASTMAMNATAVSKPADNVACCELVDKYVPISEALAADDLATAKTAAKALAQQADTDGMTGAAKAAHAIANAKDIEAARSGLKSLTSEVEPMAGSGNYVVMHCPMANADWIQTDAKVRNPYYGKMMLTCGSPKTSK